MYLLRLVATAAAAAAAAASSSRSPCLAQLEKDGCLPTDGPAKCGECGEKHRSDLLGAGCNVSFVTEYCEKKLPPASAGCLAQLAKDGCTASQGPEKCGACAHKHEPDLLKAGCSVSFVTDYCERKGPPPPPSPPAPPINGSTVSVLVFGDSWGSFGPGWHEIQDMFDRHGVPAVVRSAAVGGTQACQWAARGDEGPGSALADAAKKLFPELPAGPDHVWYTLGGNDFADKTYQECSAAAKTLAAEFACTDKLTVRVRNCTSQLLEHYWRAFPASRVMQCGYDLPCEAGAHCLPASRARSCGTNTTCLGLTTQHWQGVYIGELQARYETMRMNYTGLDILGTVQQAGGVAGAKVGQPVLEQGSPCALMAECVHPAPGKPGATAVGEAFWSLYFSKHPKL